MNNRIRFPALACLAVFVGGNVGTLPVPQDNVEFRVSVDQTTFSPGSIIPVRFTVTNIGDTVIYIHRNFGGCTSPDGFASLEILDSHNRDVVASGCSGDTLAQKDSELTGWVTNSDFWVRLSPHEICGGFAQFELPKKAGRYRLVAKLYPTSLSAHQKTILAEKGLRVLQTVANAPELFVRVK